MKLLSVFLVFVLAIYAQVVVVTTAEITCDSAAHAFGTNGNALWIQLSAPAANSAVVRWGDSNTAATRGAILKAADSVILPGVSGRVQGYDLSKLFYYCTSADKLEITYAK